MKKDFIFQEVNSELFFLIARNIEELNFEFFANEINQVKG